MSYICSQYVYEIDFQLYIIHSTKLCYEKIKIYYEEVHDRHIKIFH